MKTEEFNDKGQTLAPYASPSVEVIEVSVQRVLCGSGDFGSDIDKFTPKPDDTDNWS